MSVAFRRESDEEHLEPRFELPIPPGPNLVTAAGPVLIVGKVADLEGRIAVASTEDAVPLLRELRYWRTRAATVEVMPLPDDDEVGIGSRVTFVLNGAERTLAIVGHDEANGDTAIGFAAPLARAMIGLQAGETADFQGRADAIRILSVENQ